MHKFRYTLLLAACTLFANPVPSGKQIFNTSCAVGYCHGLDGRAGRGPRLRNRTWSKTYLYKIIELGIPGSSMPAWQGKISEDKIAAVVTYILSISKEQSEPKAEVETIDSTHSVSARESPGKALFFDLMRDRNCGVCHQVGGTGIAIAPQFRSFQGISLQALLDKITSRPTAASNVSVTLIGGEQFCGIKVAGDTNRLRIYDLTGVGPPVLRTIDNQAAISLTPCPSLNVHANNTSVYNSSELGAIAVFLTRQSPSGN